MTVFRYITEHNNFVKKTCLFWQIFVCKFRGFKGHNKKQIILNSQNFNQLSLIEAHFTFSHSISETQCFTYLIRTFYIIFYLGNAYCIEYNQYGSRGRGGEGKELEILNSFRNYMHKKAVFFYY